MPDRRPSGSRLILPAVLLAVGLPATPSQDAPPPRPAPAASDLVERAESRLVQIDVSVIDPKSDSYRSVAGLTAEQFDIRLDGRPLTSEERAALRFDPICDASAEEMPRPVLAVVDFNYVDARGRAKVADAIDRIAEAASSRRETYKIYALTRQLRDLTSGFTRNPAALREAAAAVRAVAFRGDETSALARAATASDDLAAMQALGSGRGGCSG